MSRWLVASLCVLPIMYLAACSDMTGPISPSQTLSPGETAGPRMAVDGLARLNTAGGSAARSSTSVIPFLGGAPIPGSSSTLLRNSGGISYTLKTSELEPGGTYTNWYVVFNDPSQCTGPCGEDDDVFPGAPAGVSVIFADGHVIGRNGQGNFAGRLNAGDTSGALFGPGLSDPYGAEIHIVVRGHGQPIPGMVHEQISMFNGGCAINVCDDQQEAVHVP